MTKVLRYGLLFLPAIFPLYLVKAVIFGVPFNVVEIVVYILFGLFILKGRFKNIDTDGFMLPVVLLVLGSLLGFSVIKSFDLDLMLALGVLKGWVVMPILYASMLISILENNKDRNLLFVSYVISSFALSIWALYQVVSGDYLTVDMRASGPFESANYLALYIAPAVFGLFANVLNISNFKISWKFFAEVFALIVCGGALIFSKSYGGILAVIFVFGLYVFYKILFLKFWKKVVALCLFVLFVLGGVLSQISTTKFDDFLAFERQSSSSVRIQVWHVAGVLLNENLTFGIGLSNFQNLYEKRAEEILTVKPYEKTMLHPHNLFLSSYLNAGVLGFAAFLYMILAGFVAFRKEYLFFGMFLVVLLHGMVDQPFWKNDLAMLWWTIYIPIVGVWAPVLSGKIVKGEGIGRTISYPTINILPKRDNALKGVYVCAVDICEFGFWKSRKRYYGAGFVGDKKNGVYTCEVYLLDCSKNLYNRHAKVQLLHKIRDSKKTKSLKELSVLIDNDVAYSKKYLKNI